MTTTTTHTGHQVKVETFIAKPKGGLIYQVRCHSFPGRDAHKLTAEIVDADNTVVREKHFQLGTRLISNSEQLVKARNTIDEWMNE